MVDIRDSKVLLLFSLFSLSSLSISLLEVFTRTHKLYGHNTGSFALYAMHMHIYSYKNYVSELSNVSAKKDESEANTRRKKQQQIEKERKKS